MIDINKFKNFLSIHHGDIQTPSYFYSPISLINNYIGLKEKVGTKLIVSLKANTCVDLHTRTSHILRDGYEIASIKELNSVANTSKNHPKYINNPAMTNTLLRAGLGANATIIIDNDTQLSLLEEVSRSNMQPSLMIRINGAVLKEFLEEHIVYRDDHFGVDLENLTTLIERIHKSNYKVRGFHLFKGSNTFSKTAISTIECIKKIIPILESQLGYPIEILNLGGGFSANWQSENFNFDVYREKLKSIPSYIEIMHEAGRSLFASAGVFLTRVVAVKKLNNKIIAICDGGIAHNFLLCQTEKVLKQYSEPILFSQSQSSATVKGKNPIIFVGNSCSQDDVIGKMESSIEIPQVGDICIFENCGAYNETYSVSNFLSLNKAQTYIWHD